MRTHRTSCIQELHHKKNPEDENIIFPLAEDSKSINIGFKEKRNALIESVFNDEYGKLVFKRHRLLTRNFTEMNLLG